MATYRLLRDQRNLDHGYILTLGQPTFGRLKLIAECYEPHTKRRKTLAHLTYREHAAMVPFGDNSLMIVGGRVNFKISSSVEMFSYRKKQCRSVASLNVARWCHGVCAIGGAVVVCGGYAKGYQLKSCEVFSENRWSFLREMTVDRDDVAVVSSPDRRIFAIGGCNIGGPLSSVEVCKLSTDFVSFLPLSSSEGIWRLIARMREARQGPAAIFHEGSIFVAGGYRNLNLTNILFSVEMISIDEENAQWILLPASMRKRRAFFSLVVCSNKMFAFGSKESFLNSMECWNLNTNYPVVNSSLAIATPKKIADTDINSLQEKVYCFNPDCEDILASDWESLPPISSMKRVWGAVLISTAGH